MTKYEGGASNGRSAQLDRNPRVEAYDCQGTDVMDNGTPVRIVTLVPGFAFDDAAKRTEDDPDGRYALHSKGFESVKDALDRIKWAEPCKCGRCMEGLRRGN